MRQSPRNAKRKEPPTTTPSEGPRRPIEGDSPADSRTGSPPRSRSFYLENVAVFRWCEAWSSQGQIVRLQLKLISSAGQHGEESRSAAPVRQPVMSIAVTSSIGYKPLSACGRSDGRPLGRSSLQRAGVRVGAGSSQPGTGAGCHHGPGHLRTLHLWWLASHFGVKCCVFCCAFAGN